MPTPTPPDWNTAFDGPAAEAEALWRALGEADEARHEPLAASRVEAAWARVSAMTLGGASAKPATDVERHRLPAESPATGPSVLPMSPAEARPDSAAVRPLAPMAPVRPRRRLGGYALAAAAAVAILVIANVLSGLFDSAVHVTNAGEAPMAVVLPDETRVTLEPGASLDFRPGERSREAALSGAARFEVAADIARPFSVDGGELELVVVGTDFAVVGGREAEVVVTEGHVRARGRREADWRDLFAGDAARVVDGILQAETSPVDRAGGLDFADAPLSVVAERLGAANGVSIAVPKNIEACRLTISLSTTGLDEALTTIARLVDGRYEAVPGGYALRGGRCR